MTTAIVHGDPGSYKTSALISDYLVPAVKAGRVVVTNIRGVKTVEEIADIYGFEVLDTAEIILVDFTEAGFEKMARFFHWVPEGALILMDEGQRVYPTRLRDFKSFDLLKPQDERRPRSVEDAFDSHRHMNWDIYISTPSISKVHKEIRSVAEFGYRHKNMATVLSFMKGRYKRVTHLADNSGTAIGHAISSGLRKIDARAFDVYQSTATGKTKDSAAAFSFFKQPRILLVLCILGYSVWNMGSTIYATGGVPSLLGGSVTTSSLLDAKAGVPAPVQAPVSVPSGAVSHGSDAANPFGGLTIYMVGDVMPVGVLFEVQYPDKTFISVTQAELENLGFVIFRINARMARIAFGDQIMFALPKPSPQYVAETPPNVIAPDIGLIN